MIILPSIGHVSSNDQRNLFLSQLLERNLQRIRLSFQVHKNRRIHTIDHISIPSMLKCPHIHSPNLQCPSAQYSRALVLCHVWCGASLLLWNLLLLELRDGVLDLLLLARVAAMYYIVVFGSRIVSTSNIFVPIDGLVVVLWLFDLEVFIEERFIAGEVSRVRCVGLSVPTDRRRIGPRLRLRRSLTFSL